MNCRRFSDNRQKSKILTDNRQRDEILIDNRHLEPLLRPSINHDLFETEAFCRARLFFSNLRSAVLVAWSVLLQLWKLCLVRMTQNSKQGCLFAPYSRVNVIHLNQSLISFHGVQPTVYEITDNQSGGLEQVTKVDQNECIKLADTTTSVLLLYCYCLSVNKCFYRAIEQKQSSTGKNQVQVYNISKETILIKIAYP